MAYHKMTSIAGRKAGYVAPTAAPGTNERHAQGTANAPYVYTEVRSGHWAPAKAAELARRSGVVGPVTVEWTTADTNGKGYGGIDRRCVVDGDAVTDIQVSPRESQDWADQQSADVWDR
jgi:hypothetical protein